MDETENPPTPKEPTEHPPIRLVVPGTLYPHAVVFLQRHNCAIDVRKNGTDGGVKTTVTLPPGSTRTLRHGRTASERHSITMPDGTEIREVYDPSDGHSALFIPAQPSSKESANEQ